MSQAPRNGVRDVAALIGGEKARIRLEWRPLGHYDYAVTATVGDLDVSSTASDLFEALANVRLQLEPMGVMLAVNGARRDTFPSGMARDMGGGSVVYVLKPDTTPAQDDLVPTFDDAPHNLAATVNEQRASYDELTEAWRSRPA